MNGIAPSNPVSAVMSASIAISVVSRAGSGCCSHKPRADVSSSSRK